jgi:SAM-dependent methyltransferase
MITAREYNADEVSRISPMFREDAFSRLDEGEDTLFYSKDRFVSHLDSLALEAVERLIGELIVEENAVILDLMAGWDSHIPEKIKPGKVVGLGLNRNELNRNQALDERVFHDLNSETVLPFESNTFDAVINTVSVDYMTRPTEVYKEVGRILKPGGLFLVIFSNRMFPQKAFKLWRESSEDERVILVEEFFKQSGEFEKTTLFVSKGKPRPKDDKYGGLTNHSDPVYAVYAEKKGAGSCEKIRPVVTAGFGKMLDKEELERKKKAVGETLRCPHCNEKLKKWEVPDNPFCQTWDNDFMYICFNDDCPYFIRGWDRMYVETNQGMSYRFMYNPDNDCCMPIPVPTPSALKDGIIEGN